MAASNKSEGSKAVVTGEQPFATIIRHGVSLAPDRVKMLSDGLNRGLSFFENFNESRLKLAFASFDELMKIALYEVIYLLHVNDPSLADMKFKGVNLEHMVGWVREAPYDATANLYVEGAPHGVEGIERISPVFKEAFEAHIQSEFGQSITPGSAYGFCPIVSIGSLGSIGTVGHKSLDSDLDLQIQFEVEPFLFETKNLKDQDFIDAIQAEIKFWVNRQQVAQKIPTDSMKKPDVVKGLTNKAHAQVAKTYPHLYKYLVKKQGSIVSDLGGAKGNQIQTVVLHELMQLMKRATRLSRAEEIKKGEELLKERINRIQDYIEKKYPQAEVYLFTASNDNFRKGYHGTTLESKEASGSAYELILNYETLMPGIQMTPMVPTHFVLPQKINDDPGIYDRIIDYIRFGAMDIYKDVRTKVTNLGATPDIGVKYVAKHSGAVYWEAFKASSGNLPKATLNLFRYEMLLDERFNKTNIQIIKNPKVLNQYVKPKPEDPMEDLELMISGTSGIPVWALHDLEESFPLLLQDPWWQRYKALKIGYSEEKGIPGLGIDERHQTSKIIDLAFALHVRISDIFTKPGDQGFTNHRDLVLAEFYRRAFPPASPSRLFLERLFAGEINSVTSFETALRFLFKRGLERANNKIEALDVQSDSNQKEFEIWYHFYQMNFEPPKNVVPRTIMQQLTVPRTRVQLGVVPKQGWFFRSIQKASNLSKRFDTFGHLNHLPEEVMLREKSDFLMGLADCVMNGYFGIFNQGTLKETTTMLEFDSKHMDLGNRIDNTMAFLRPDSLTRIVKMITDHFPYQKYHYMDCIRQKREITEVVILFNLMKYGRVSVVYRDNLRTWYVDNFDHPPVYQLAHKIRANFKALIMAKPIHMTLAKFFKVKGINLDKISLTAWVNPNSVETNHSTAQIPQKENELSQMFLQIVRQIHGPKKPQEGAPPPANGETGEKATG